MIALVIILFSLIADINSEHYYLSLKQYSTAFKVTKLRTSFKILRTLRSSLMGDLSVQEPIHMSYPIKEKLF